MNTKARGVYRVTLTSIADAVICTDAEDQITFINPVAERLTGCRCRMLLVTLSTMSFRL